MPAPAAPSSLTVTARAQGYYTGGAHKDVARVTCNAVAGATKYTFYSDELGEVETDVNFIVVPFPEAPMKGGTLSAALANNMKVKAGNDSGYSAFHNPALDVTARGTVTGASLSDIAAPAATLALITSPTTIDVTFTFTSTNQFEFFVRATIYDGVDAVGVAYMAAILAQGGGTLRVNLLDPVAPATTYTAKMQSLSVKASGTESWIKEEATGVTVLATAYGITPKAIAVVAGQRFTQQLSVIDTASILEGISLPAGFVVSPKVGAALQTISGTLEEGEHTLFIGQSIGGVSQVVTLEVTAGPALSAAEVIECWQGDSILSLVTYLGSGGPEDAAQWTISNGPPGVIMSDTLVAGQQSHSPNAATITGIPSAPGLYEATVSCLVAIDEEAYLYQLGVTFKVSGGLFLGWFHDGTARELQALLWSRQVKWYVPPGVTEGPFELTRGDDELLYVIVRTGPTASGGAMYGREVISAGDLTDVRLMVRPLDDRDAEPLLELGPTQASTVVFGGNTVMYFTFRVTSAAIEKRFEAMNKSAGPDAGQLVIMGVGEVTFGYGLTKPTMGPFSVRILQDVDR